MSRFLIFAALLSVASAAPRPDHLGQWGEDPSVVPDFCPIEERRAPKLPGGDKVWAELQPTHAWDGIDQGLLVCKLQVGAAEPAGDRGIRAFLSLGMSEIHRTNATVRFTVGNAPTIMLWGPLLHDASYVSIPALTMQRGDTLTLALADRTMRGEKQLGKVALTWDGTSPFAFETPAWSAHCVVTDAADAHKRATWWLQSLDRLLAALAAAKPVRDQPELGRPTKTIEQLRNVFTDQQTHEGNFRYAAGFVGWEAPEIQTRLSQMRDAEAAFERAATDEVHAMVAALEPAPLSLGPLQATLRGKGLTVAVHVGEGDAIACKELLEPLAEMQLVDEHGRFHDIDASFTDKRHHKCDALQPTTVLTPPLEGVFRDDDIKDVHTPPIVLLHTKTGFVRPTR